MEEIDMKNAGTNPAEMKADEKSGRRRSRVLCAVLLAVSLANWFVQFQLVKTLPPSVPVHAGPLMEVDRWGSPLEVQIYCLLPVVLSAVMLAVLGFAKLRGQNRKVLHLIVIFSSVLFLGASWMGVYMAFQYETAAAGEPLPVTMLLFELLPLAVFLVVTGNYSALIKPNRWFGFRTRSTFADENLWRKTHRFGGFCLVAAGIALGALSLIAAATNNPIPALVGLGAMIALALIPALYARILKGRRP